MGVAEIAGDLLGLHHGGAAVGQRGFLAGLGLELAEFLDRVTQPIGLAGRALDIGAVLRDRILGLAAGIPKIFDGSGVLFQPAVGVEQAAMGRGIDQRAGIVLAVDLDQRRAQRLQGLHADRLVVDEGAGSAVGELHAAQDHRLVGAPHRQAARAPDASAAVRTSP